VITDIKERATTSKESSRSIISSAAAKMNVNEMVEMTKITNLTIEQYEEQEKIRIIL
jgi:hypothetical protein